MHSCMDHAARSGTAGRLSMVITANLEHEPYLAGGRSHCRPIEQGNPSSLYSMRRVLCSLRGSCLRSLVDDAAGLALAAPRPRRGRCRGSSPPTAYSFVVV